MSSVSENNLPARAPAANEDRHVNGYVKKFFATRSFAEQPLATSWRALSYIALTRARVPASFTIRFGDVSFKMRLQRPKPKFGIANIYLQRRYYEPLLEFGHKLLSAGESAVDGGASQGVYSCAFAAKIGASGRVYAFEPLDYAIQCLRNNIALNGFDNVTVFAGALSETAGSAFIDISRGPSYGSIVHGFGDQSGNNVTTFSVDELRRQGCIGPVHFIKLDVEGAELAALKGAGETIEKDRPRLCIEANEKDDFDLAAAFLSTFRLKPYVFDERGALHRFDRFVPTANVFFLD